MMKRFNIIVLFFLAATHSFAQSAEEKGVKEAFNHYKSAILNDQGEAAYSVIDQRTAKYYGDILELIKTADSARLQSLTLIDKITVFSIRHRAPQEEVKQMDGKGLFIYAIKNGMVGKNSVANNTIGEVTIDKAFAKGQLLVKGQKAPVYFHFYKESGQWKLDLTSIFPISNLAFKKMVEESGQDENEFLFSLLHSLTGKMPGAEIWHPINK